MCIYIYIYMHAHIFIFISHLYPNILTQFHENVEASIMSKFLISTNPKYALSKPRLDGPASYLFRYEQQPWRRPLSALPFWAGPAGTTSTRLPTFMCTRLLPVRPPAPRRLFGMLLVRRLNVFIKSHLLIQRLSSSTTDFGFVMMAPSVRLLAERGKSTRSRCCFDISRPSWTYLFRSSTQTV